MSKRKSIIIISVLAGIAVGIIATLVANSLYIKSSSNDSCASCHYHPESVSSWKQSYHYNNPSGTVTDCVECHLPNEEGTFRRFSAKARTGLKDVWSSIIKKKEDIDWDAKGEIDYASKIVYNESCVNCHANLFPEGISDDGVTAHLYYDENAEKLDLQCISCHLDAGHYNPSYTHGKMVGVPSASSDESAEYTQPASVTAFGNFVETIPGTTASISMIAVPGGTFTIGSPQNEAFRKQDEGPMKSVTVSPFFMGEVEVTWDQFWAFYYETMSEGRIDPETIYENNSSEDLTVDAVSGPTPPFGAPDQSWGMGSRPAITMTHYSAETFCQWLSLKTGRNYRLPTEAEWEYAARGGTATPYFFKGDPRKLSSEGLWNNVFGADTTGIASYVVYAANSHNRTQEPAFVAANPFGLKNMLGNVMEYCSDWYSENAYSLIEEGQTDPQGPDSGREHVVRGGSYSSDAADLRCASRFSTHHDEWLRTDPQNPKSIWWYSDVKAVGFRVVCDVPDDIK